MKMIFRIDDFIIAKLEKFAHSFQLWTGKNNFWLSRLFYGLWCIFAILQAFSLMVTTVLCLAVFSWIIMSLQKERLFLERPNVLNREKILPAAKLLRVTFVIFTIIIEVNDLIIFLDNGDVMGLISVRYFLSFTLAIYFDALNPLPPGKNKIKEIVKAIAKFRIAVPHPEVAGQ